MGSCILPTVYWGPVQYYSVVLHSPQVYIERWETYPKQTYRNRCVIYSPNGAQALMVPVERGSFHKILTKDIRISFDTLWVKNHLKSLEAAYRSSPFFEFYFDDVLQVYQKNHQFLLDLNHEILSVTLDWLKVKAKVDLTEIYQSKGDFTDLRQVIHPKKASVKSKMVPYTQGFEQRHGFIPNLSILDLVFNTGTDAREIIENSFV